MCNSMRLIACLFLFIVCRIGIGAEQPVPFKSDAYRICLSLDPTRGDVRGEMTLNYLNDSNAPLDEVRLRLDMNLGKKQKISIVSVKDSAGRDLKWGYESFKFAKFESSQGQLRVSLPGPLDPGRTASLTIIFDGHTPAVSSGMITLQDDPFISFDAWYPKAMSKCNGAWSIDDDRPSSYTVALDLPAGFQVAGSGQSIEETHGSGGRMSVTLQAQGIRGFSVYASPMWKRYQAKAGSVDVSVFLPAGAEEMAKPIADGAIDVIQYYEKTYGPYPARHLDVIGLGDMKGPAHGSSASYNTIVLWLGGNFKDQYRWLLAHEVAHQYFGSAVGLPRNEIGWAPMCLGFIMDRHYMVSRGFPNERNEKSLIWFFEEAQRRGYNTSLSQSAESLMMADAPWSSGWNMSLMHGKAYLAGSKLEQWMGEKLMQSVIQRMIRADSGELLRNDDLIAACQKVAGKPIDPAIMEWLNGKAGIKPTPGS